MKLLVLTLAVCRVLLAINSCNPSYTCGRFCYGYHGDTITVCRTGIDTTRFHESVDSLNALYGPGTVFYADTVNVTGYSTNAVNAIVNQLEEQGYTCYSN